MDIEKILKDLGNYHQFAQFLTLITSLRDECIGELHQASTEDIQQISGKILSYDQILVMCKYDELKKRHSQFID